MTIMLDDDILYNKDVREIYLNDICLNNLS